MKASTRKSINDLRINPGRTALVVLALVIGLWGVGTIAISYSILKSDLNENFMATIPPHAIVTADSFVGLNLTDFRNRPEIEKAEFRDLSIQRIEVYPGKWLPLWIFGVENFNDFNLARVYHQSGKMIPDPGSLLIERDGQNPRVSNLVIGSNPRVRIGSKIISVPVTGIVFDPSQAPATQDAFIYSYTDKKTFKNMTHEATDQRLIFRLKNVNSKQEIELLSKQILRDFKKAGIAVKTTEIPRFNQHPHQFQLNTLMLLNGAIGLLAFLMGAVLVSQLMAAILTQQNRQIGILKAIGATSYQVLRIYLVMIIFMGVLSSAIAIPLAVASGYGYAGFVAKTLNFEILTKSLSWQLYACITAAGLLLPIALSLPALLKGIRISVHDAITDYGIPQRTKSSGARRASIIPISYTMKLAFRNSLRRKKRLSITVATMALGVAIFSTGFNVRQSLILFLGDSREAMKHDVQVVLKEQISQAKALSPFKMLPNLARIETWNGGKGRLQSGKISTANGVGIVALPYDTNLVQWNLIAGRWLQASESLEIVMNQQAVDAFGMPVVGNNYPIEIKGRILQARLVGIIKEFDVAKIYIDRRQYDSLVNPGHLVNSLMFVAKDNSYKNIIALKHEIEKVIAASELDVLYVMSQAERGQIIYDHLNIILSILAFLALLVLVVSALGMASATSISIMERTREIGVMRAIGATPKKIYGLFVAEGMFVSALSIAAGLGLAWPMSIVASAFFGYLILGAETPLNFAFSGTGFIITLIITFAFGWLASRIPARSAIRISTRAALAYE